MNEWYFLRHMPNQQANSDPWGALIKIKLQYGPIRTGWVIGIGNLHLPQCVQDVYSSQESEYSGWKVITMTTTHQNIFLLSFPHTWVCIMQNLILPNYKLKTNLLPSHVYLSLVWYLKFTFRNWTQRWHGYESIAYKPHAFDTQG